MPAEAATIENLLANDARYAIVLHTATTRAIVGCDRARELAALGAVERSYDRAGYPVYTATVLGRLMSRKHDIACRRPVAAIHLGR